MAVLAFDTDSRYTSTGWSSGCWYAEVDIVIGCTLTGDTMLAWLLRLERESVVKSDVTVLLRVLRVSCPFAISSGRYSSVSIFDCRKLRLPPVVFVVPDDVGACDLANLKFVVYFTSDPILERSLETSLASVELTLSVSEAVDDNAGPPWSCFIPFLSCSDRFLCA